MRMLILPVVLLLSGCSEKKDPPSAPPVKENMPATKPPAQPPPGKAPGSSSTQPLSGEDRMRLTRQEAVVLKLIQSRYGEDATLKHSKTDFTLLQKLIDDKALRPDQTYELQCLGIALGQVYAAETPLRWVMVEDEYGRDPALQYPDTTIILFPLTMISKRVEQGREVDVADIFRGTMDLVAKTKEKLSGK
jgi:hypothetical protein